MLRRCVPIEEHVGILFDCHSSSYGGHFGPTGTTEKYCTLVFIGPVCLRIVIHFLEFMIGARERVIFLDSMNSPCLPF